jgi:glutamine amidotransferase
MLALPLDSDAVDELRGFRADILPGLYLKVFTARSPVPTPDSRTVTVAHLGIGNVGSVVNMLRHLGHAVRVSSSPDEIAAADKVVLPGVGHWETAVRQLDELGVREALGEVVSRGVPALGICLGMQLLLEASEEGSGPGLGFVPGKVVHFRETVGADGQTLRVPHMGWNAVEPTTLQDPIVSRLEPDSRFYFVHSYHADGVPSDNILLTASYGYEFACGVRHENVWGFQFHPEKSHRFGMALMRAFAEV